MANSTVDHLFESYVLSEIPAKKYQKALILNGDRIFNLSQRICNKIISFEVLKKAKVAPGNISQSDGVVKFLSTAMFGSETMEEVSDNQYDLIIICDLMYPEYIGRSKLLVYEVIKQCLEVNGILLTIHRNEKYVGRFPLFILDEYLFEFENKNFFLEVYSK